MTKYCRYRSNIKGDVVVDFVGTGAFLQAARQTHSVRHRTARHGEQFVAQVLRRPHRDLIFPIR